ncbi:ABC transporter ATP-binding protein [Vallitalea okinawensis]|uniref:ABC transporter ATP-binding protein n=1 Tax=Vallitalea okinawensis TaxID=2078660 RepID=UPI000CFB1356|nr:ABC transporter ATP-binding protein [Vallitalea okinawensis]
MEKELLSMRNITKIYSNGVMANKDVNFSVRKGEIHALMGENGAGKSTLMKILFGAQGMDSGSIYFRGQEITKLNSQQAIDLGIGMVHQHFMLVDSLKVYENVVMGMEPKKGFIIDNKKAYEMVKDVAEKYNLKVDPAAKISNLSVGLKQKVEIIKVLARGAKLLILDEPTAVLTPQETEELFEQLLLLKEAGHTVIFISHKIKEVRRICDRITVLRGGRSVGTMDVADSTEEEISKFMVGREVVLKVNKSEPNFGEALLDVQNITYINSEKKKVVNDVSFKVKKGQILGIAGVEGNGQKELADCIFGLNQNVKGKILFNNKNLLDNSIKEIRESGISFIPEDRMTTGVATKVSIWENLISDRIDKAHLKEKGLLSMKKIRELANHLIKDFAILCRNMNQEVSMLSGGNMQKVVVAREMSADPQLLIANQPTRGIDVGANEFIWKKLIDLRDKERGIILISADLNEVLELSDSILVMHEGKVAGYFEDASELDEYNLGLYMLGLKKQTNGGEEIDEDK